MRILKITRRRWQVLRAIMALARGGQFAINHIIGAATGLSESQVKQEIHTLGTVFGLIKVKSVDVCEIIDAATIAANHWRHVFVFEKKRCRRLKIKGSPLLIEARAMLARIGIPVPEMENDNGSENRTCEVERAHAETRAEEVEAAQEA